MTQSPHTVYAGLVSRGGALVFDLVLVTLGAIAVGGLPGLIWHEVTRLPTPDWLSSAAHAAAIVLPWLYFTSFWWLTGQTLGGLVTGTVVRRRDGAEISLPQAGLRAFFGLLLAPLWIVGLLWVVVDQRRRAWHDFVFGTTVRYADVTTPAPVRPRSG